jgi:hypothetical protein
MRYIIIPLVPLLYIWWTAKAIKDFKSGIGIYSSFWFIFHLFIVAPLLGVFIIAPTIKFIIKYW